MHVSLLCLMLAIAADTSAAVKLPTATDARLKIELFAAEPEIVTPCGIAVDARGNVLVVESHTHFRPENYVGPPTDRVRMFSDTDGDGRADRITTFHEGTRSTMNVAVHPDGSVYVATRMEILRLRDTNNDGLADEKTRIAHLETKGDYPHNGLSGFAFDYRGDVFFGLGENLGSEFKLIGTDGLIVSDLEGGQIYRCQGDGSAIRRVAFGFWNPFHLAFDAFGRLFAVDNDPDSMPPCRLMHIVDGGNYGYRYRNGRKGVHPFTAWNGELPGTLPMVAGTGEAPSGVLAYESDHLPDDYLGNLLVTSWGDHRLERYRLEPRGASFRAVTETFIKGDENFRPVGIAVAPDGSLFVSDWVLQDYNVHGKGRLWHVTSANPKAIKRATAPELVIHATDRSTRENAARSLATRDDGRKLLTSLAADAPSTRTRALAVTALAAVDVTAPAISAASHDASSDVRAAAVRVLGDNQALSPLLKTEPAAEVRAEIMRHTSDPALQVALWPAVSDTDAFVAQAARKGLARLHAVTPETDFAKLTATERLACLLILREANVPDGTRALPKFLRDPDTAVRFAAVQWVGEERLKEFRQPLIEALSAGPATSRLFGGYLSALERLDGVVRTSDNEWAGERYIVRALEDPATSAEARRWGVRMLRPDHPLLTVERLRGYLQSDDPGLQLEALRSLRDSKQADRDALLNEIAGSDSYSKRVRAEAIVGILPNTPVNQALLFLIIQPLSTHFLHLTASAWRSLLKMTATASGLLFQLNVFDGHCTIDCLAHIVHRQRRHAHRHQRLHFHTRPRRSHRGRHDHHLLGVGKVEFEFNGIERHLVTQRDERRRLLGGHNSGEPSHFQHVSLTTFAVTHQRERFWLHAHTTTSGGHTLGQGLGCHVDHVASTFGVKVCQVAHGSRTRLNRIINRRRFSSITRRARAEMRRAEKQTLF